MIASLAACGDNTEVQPDANGADAPVADAAAPDGGPITTPACSTVSGTKAVTFTLDEGATFAATAPLSGTTYVYGLAGLSTPGALVAAVDAQVLRSDDAGCTWRQLGTVDDTLDPGLVKLTADGAGHAYGYVDNRQAVFSVGDSVETHATEWTVIGLTPTGAAGHFRVVDGVHAQLQETEDGGATWTRVGGPAFDDSLGISYRGVFAPDDPDHVLIGAAVSGVRLTRDGGATWTVPSGLPRPANVYSIAFSPASSDVVWLEARDGAASIRRIYRSTDGGDSFVSVVDDSPEVNLINGTLLAPHPTDPNLLYFTYGQSYQNYGTDLYRFDATTGVVTSAHHPAHGIDAIAFAPWNPAVMYLGLSHEAVN